MPTTNKTPNLGLNNWVGTDKPKRTDFVEDNTIIDTVISTHIKDSTLHLSADDRTALEKPVVTGLICGNGAASALFTLPFTPRAVFIFNSGAVTEYRADKQYTVVNTGAAVGTSHTPGISVSGADVTLYQSQTEPQAGGVFFNLNMNYGQYFYIAIR